MKFQILKTILKNYGKSNNQNANFANKFITSQMNIINNIYVDRQRYVVKIVGLKWKENELIDMLKYVSLETVLNVIKRYT